MSADSANATEKLIYAYYDAFNAGDKAAFLDLLTDDVIHDINQGGSETGKADFAAFFDRMAQNYREQISDLIVLVSNDGTRAAAEFVVNGIYLQADEGLPPAHGQSYVLPAGAFFTMRGNRVARISNYYNLPEWIRQVS